MLIANNAGEDHAEAIADILNDADEITIAVAFLKVGGADHIIPMLQKVLAAGGPVELFIGTDFFHTQPAALTKLFELQKRYPTCNVMIANQSKATFHPKAYVARHGEEYRSLIGSANLTAGALSENEELSLRVAHGADDALSAQLAATFMRYREDARFQKLELLALQQYTTSYEINRKLKKKFERELEAALSSTFDLRLIEDWYARYLADPVAMKDLADRKVRVTTAGKVQKDIAALSQAPLNRATRAAFHAHLSDLIGSKGYQHLWGSGDIHRQGTQALKHPKEMIALFALGQSVARRTPFQAYDAMRRAAKLIPGVGSNTVTEILCSFAPTRYAVYNGNTVGALEALGITPPASPNLDSISPIRYETICATIEALGARIGGANMSEADAFLNWLYWKTKKARRKAGGK